MAPSEPRVTLQVLKVLNAIMRAEGRELSGADIASVTGLKSGTLYPILLRLEDAKWLSSRWEEVAPREVGRPRRRLYRATAVGALCATQAIKEIEALGALSWA
jgi:PadR family transcriptional regulator, regulatory protein PadR